MPSHMLAVFPEATVLRWKLPIHVFINNGYWLEQRGPELT